MFNKTSSYLQLNKREREEKDEENIKTKTKEEIQPEEVIEDINKKGLKRIKLDEMSMSTDAGNVQDKPVEARWQQHPSSPPPKSPKQRHISPGKLP